MIILLSVAFVLIVAVATTLGILLPDCNNGPDQEKVISIVPASPVGYKPNKFVPLQNIVSQAVVEENLLFDTYSPQRLALNWLAEEDGVDLGSNLCTSSSDDDTDIDSSLTTPTTAVAIDDDGLVHRLRLKKQRKNGPDDDRKLALCHAEERVIRRYALAVFYYATMDLPP